jgi:predicted acetyltransferase
MFLISYEKIICFLSSFVGVIAKEFNMIADYNKDRNLFEKCITFINTIFPGAKEFAIKGMQYGASWAETSIPFIIEKDNEIIAHAGVLPLTIILNGKMHQTAAIHAVAVNPLHRGKGYFKQLMQEVMTYIEKEFESSFLETSKPYLYKNYPYKVMLPEYDFVVKRDIKANLSNSDLRTLNLDNEEELTLLRQLLSNRIPMSNQFSLQGKNSNTLFILNAMYGKIWYSERLNAVIVYQINDEMLFIKEIVAEKKLQLQEIIEVVPDSFNKVILQFCPDKFLNENEFEAQLAKPENCVMVSPTFKFDGKYFRYPEIYGC